MAIEPRELGRMEAQVEQIGVTVAAIKETLDEMKTVSSQQSVDLAVLKTEMRIVKWAGGAVGLATIAGIAEMLFRII